MDQLAVLDARDFTIGRIQLARHLGLGVGFVCALGAAGGYGRQLRLDEPSALPSGRVPLFVCSCGDLECGALTVAIAEDGGRIRWAEFGWEAPGSTFTQDDVLRRLGPFSFDRAEYRYALSSYA